MINEIHVRTDKGEYCPGEDICGVVYLRIARPTRGTGIQVVFKGYEKFIYEYKDESAGATQMTIREYRESSYTEHKDYIKHEVELYKSQGGEPLNMENGLYPFKINLPSELPDEWYGNLKYFPFIAIKILFSIGVVGVFIRVVKRTPTEGTFYTKGNKGAIAWQVMVEYILHVSVICQPQLQVQQPVVIMQPCACPTSSLPQAVHIAHPIRFFLFMRRNLHITARLHQHVHRTGEVLKLRVIITNNSSVTVQALKINLIRTLLLMCKKPKLDKSSGDDHVTENESGDRVFISIDEDSLVGREQTINMVPYQMGLDCIQIPLKNMDNSAILPSTRGLHVNCSYKVCLHAELSNGSVVTLDVPVSVIMAKKNSQWQQWTAPDWLAHDTFNIVNSDSIFGVPDNILSQTSFSSMPGFQVL